jgi:glutathione peroxidase
MLENCQKSCFGKSPVSKLESIYDIDNELDINGQVINFNQFRGKVLYIVNVASKCGYTAENYEMFKKLQKYRSQGLEIILAPCNQFGSQEPGDSGTISNFIRDQEFEGTVLSKADVNGDNTRPLFSYLKKATGKTRISWYVNFVLM